MKAIVSYFLNRPIIVNAIMFALLLSSLIAWQKIGKEEMPEFAMNSIRIKLKYPGASAEDVELFVTKPIEEKLKGITSIEEVETVSSYASSFFNISFNPKISDLREKIQEVKEAIDSVDFPGEVDEPIYRQFKSSEKAVIDIGIYLKGVEILNVEDRNLLQSYALAFKNKILALPEISGVEESGYLRSELQVKVHPDLLEKYEISMNQVKSQIVSQHVRKPIGNMKDKQETEVTLVSELNSIDSLKEVIVTSGFQGHSLKLDKIAKIEKGFETTNTIYKVQGHEGIIFNIKKSESVDILSAKKALVGFLESFRKNNNEAPVDFVLIDDESYDVKNRLSLIGFNGLIGFFLILIFLLLFLDFRAGIWVAMGMPFALAFTLIISIFLGFTINNMTLAAIIIVLGIVVDDAIIVAENISRNCKGNKLCLVTQSVIEVLPPVIVSVLTTCAAFLPLYFFSGRFGLFVKYIPTIICLMLFASIIESFFILPAHMSHESKMEKLLKKLFNFDQFSYFRENMTNKVEIFYSNFLYKILNYRIIIFFFFICLLLISTYIFKKHMNYVMFPREESRDFRVKVLASSVINRYEMAELVRKVEDIFLDDNRGIVTSVRTTIGQNRRGGEVRENEASIRVEVVPPSKRKLSLNKLIKGWNDQANILDGFDEIRFQKNRFGSDSGSPIAIEIQENNDVLRNKIVTILKNELEKDKNLINIEIERPVVKQQYKLTIKKDQASRLGVNYEKLASTLRSYIEGDILYTLNNGDEEVDLRFTANDENKSDVKKLLNLSVSNEYNYLVPINNLVKLNENKKDANIQRVNFKRASMLYADLSKNTKLTPLQIATNIEKKILPNILKGNPSSHIQFKEEVEASRESKSDFIFSITLALIIIYLLLIFLFNSFLTPFLIAAIIPFGIVGSILAFWMHGMSQYGFFAIVGTLGMTGVVINDAIVLIDRLNTKIKNLDNLFLNISKISATRLRAILITTITTVVALSPTAYGIGGYDSMLAEMMLAMGWGLIFGMFITLILVPCIYSFYVQVILNKDIKVKV